MKPTNVNYQVFIAALSIISIVNFFLLILIPDPNTRGIIYIMDKFFSIIFVADFLHRLFTAESKSYYFSKEGGWADLLSSVLHPAAKLLRFMYLRRTIKTLRAVGTRKVIRGYIRDTAQSALLTLFLLIILVLEFGGMAMLAIEGKIESGNIKTANDALWYIFVTIATVGYGDRYPTTEAGRYLGMIIMTIGVALFGTLTGYLSNTFLKNYGKE